MRVILISCKGYLMPTAPAATKGSPVHARSRRLKLHRVPLALASITSLLAVTAPPGRAQEAGGIALPPIDVEASGETAHGPVRGYVAGRSAAGTKTDTPLIETPQSVSVVTRDQIEATGAQTVAEALRYTAGVQPEVRGRSSAVEIMNARGFTLDRYWNGLRLPQIGTYGAPQLDPWLLERLEVLRGPASVLYGQVAPAGLVNMVSRLPSGVPMREVMLGTGNYGRIQGGFDVGDRIDPDGRLAFRVTGMGYRADTQVDDTAIARYALAPSLTWRPDASTSLTFYGLYQRDPDNYHDVVPAVGTVFPNPLGRVPTSFLAGEPGFARYDREQYAFGWMFEHRFDDVWTLRQNTRYDRSSFALDTVMLAGLAADNRTVSRYSLANRTDGEGIGSDTQIQARFTTGPVSHTVLAGVDYQLSRSSVRQGTGFAPSIDLFRPIHGTAIVAPAYTSSTSQQQEQIGVYVQDQLRLGRLTLVAGARYDWADGVTRNRITGAEARQDDGAASWRIGAVYEVAAGLAPYASYSTSFQPTSGADYAGMPFRPTEAEQYEVGIRYQPPGGQSVVTLAAFNILQDNVLTADTAHACTAVPRPPRCGNFSVQTGRVRSRGIDLEGRLNLLPGLNLLFAASYLESEVRTDNNPALIGRTRISTPNHTASLWGDYTVQDGPLAGLGFGAGIRYVGSSPGDALNSFWAPSYTLADAMLRYDFGPRHPQLDGLRLTINASNIFDKDYVANCGATSWCMYGLRRTVTASLRYRW